MIWVEFKYRFGDMARSKVDFLSEGNKKQENFEIGPKFKMIIIYNNAVLRVITI